jgi:hypothetical protein
MIKRYIVLFALCSLLYPLCLLPSDACASAEWEVTVRVEAAGGHNDLILGADATATDGYDPVWEVYAMLGGYLEAYFPHPEWEMVHDIFCRDIKAKAHGKTMEWSFVADSSEDESGNPYLYNYNFTITWDLSRVPEDYTILLTDNTTAQQLDMRLNTSYSFLYTDSRTFKVTVYVPPDVVLPDPPQGLTGEWTRAGVVLSWEENSELDLAGYNVYRSKTPGSGYRKINRSLVSRNKFIDPRVVKGRTYYYVVTAVNTSGGESGYSNMIEVTCRRLKLQ